MDSGYDDEYSYFTVNAKSPYILASTLLTHVVCCSRSAGVLQPLKDAFVEVGACIEQASLPGVEFQFEPEVLVHLHVGYRFHRYLLSANLSRSLTRRWVPVLQAPHA